MALKLELKSTIIPIEIGDFKFEVDMTDTKRKAIEEKLLLFTTEAANLDENNPEDEAKLKELLEIMYDELFGSGAFNKLYTHTQSLEILSNVLAHTVVGIKQSLQERVIYNPNLQTVPETEKPPKKKSKFGGRK